MAALALEKISAYPFQTYLEEKICKPLGLKQTFLGKGFRNGSSLPGLGKGLQRRDGVFIPCPDWSLETGFSGYGLISCVQDLNCWIRALFKGAIIPSSFVKLMTTSHLNNYGCGVMINTFKGNLTWFHNGGFNGVSTTTRYLPEKDISIIILSNLNIDYSFFDKELEKFSVSFSDQEERGLRETYFKTYPDAALHYKQSTIYHLADHLCELL